MSAELDKRVDELRARLIKTAGVPISMGNYKQQLRTYQEMMLELINIVDEVNGANEKVSTPVLDAIKKAIQDLVTKAKSEGEK